jgi:hypothetical protein
VIGAESVAVSTAAPKTGAPMGKNDQINVHFRMVIPAPPPPTKLVSKNRGKAKFSGFPANKAIPIMKP